MSKKALWKSFGAGEITPELFGRIDLARMQNGLKTALNFHILPHGPAQSRAGLQYVVETKDSTKASILVPFIFSSTQTYQLEFGHQYMRIHTDAGTVLEAAQAITSATSASPGVFSKVGHGLSTGDWLYWTDVVGLGNLDSRFMKVVVLTPDTFTLTDLAGAAFSTVGLGLFSSGNAARVYEIATPYAAADLEALHYAQSNDVMTLTHPSYQQRELARSGLTSWSLTAVSFSPTQVAPAAASVVPNAAGGTSYSYVTTALAAGTLEESLASAVTTNAACQLLSVAGAFNTITPPATAGAVRYNVFKLLNGLYGYIGQTDGSGFKDDNITPDTTKTPPLVNDPFVGAGNYPSAVGYFSGRKWFAGTTNKPQGLWGTRSGTERNLTYSIPLKDDDAISVNLTARQANVIRHILPVSDLLLLTSGAEWKVETQNSDVLTPLTISYKPEDFVGASNVTPAVTAGAVLYAQDRGGHVRELKYEYQQRGYRTNDLSLLAPHLFDGYTITSMAYARAPSPVLWVTRSDGVMLGCTYVPEQEVLAWHQHSTDGVFEWVSVTPEGPEDFAYCIVRRTIGSRTVRYVERMASRRFATLQDAFCVDAGATYSGAETGIVTNLWHLAGESVAVLADGAVIGGLSVTADGKLTLPVGVLASKIHIGLGYNCDFETLPLANEAPGHGQTEQKNVSNVHVRINQSSGLRVGPSFDKLVLMKQRTSEPYGAPPALTTGKYKISLTPTWGEDGNVCVRQADPLPLTVLAMAVEYA